MQSHPWTDNQVTLAMVAILLAICCLIILTIDQLHNHIIAPASEDSVTHLLFALPVGPGSALAVAEFGTAVRAGSTRRVVSCWRHLVSSQWRIKM